MIRANRFARFARFRWSARIGNSSDSCESDWRAIKNRGFNCEWFARIDSRESRCESPVPLSQGKKTHKHKQTGGSFFTYSRSFSCLQLELFCLQCKQGSSTVSRKLQTVRKKAASETNLGDCPGTGWVVRNVYAFFFFFGGGGGGGSFLCKGKSKHDNHNESHI